MELFSPNTEKNCFVPGYKEDVSILHKPNWTGVIKLYYWLTYTEPNSAGKLFM